MHLLYLDDSGSASNRNEAYLVLAGFSVFERQVHWLTTELDRLAATFSPENSDAVEFHASEIFSRRRPPWNNRTKEEARDVIASTLRTVASSHPSTSLFAVAVHKASFPQSDPMELAFEELCNRFDLRLMRMFNEGDPQRGLIILDESSYETSLQGLARNFRKLGTRWGVLRNIVDTPLFVDSRASRAVQLADQIAYAVFRRYEKGDTSFFDLIAKRFDAVDGRVHGLVHKQTVDPLCMCLACATRRVTSGE